MMLETGYIYSGLKMRWLVWGWELLSLSWGWLLDFRIGYWVGVTAGWEQEGKHPCPLFFLSTGLHAGRAWGQAGQVWMLTFHAAMFHCTKPSFISLCLFHTLLCPALGWDWRTEKKQSASLPTIPLVGLHAPQGFCLMQGVTPGEDPPLPSMCPKPGANSPSWPTQLCQKLCPGFVTWSSPGIVLSLSGEMLALLSCPILFSLLCLCCPPSFPPPTCMSKYATKPWDFASKWSQASHILLFGLWWDEGIKHIYQFNAFWTKAHI